MVQVAVQNAEHQDAADIEIVIPCSIVLSGKVGKLTRQVSADINATTDLPLFNVAVHLSRSHNTIQFVVDTGAAVSIIPPKYVPMGCSLEPSTVVFSQAGGNPLKVHGEVTLNVSIKSLRRSFIWVFVVADFMYPLLGSDFLSHFKLVVDCAGQCIRDLTTAVTTQVMFSPAVQSVSVTTLSGIEPRVRSLLQNFPRLTEPYVFTYDTTANQPVTHCIDTGSAPPVYSAPRRLSP